MERPELERSCDQLLQDAGCRADEGVDDLEIVRRPPQRNWIGVIGLFRDDLTVGRDAFVFTGWTRRKLAYGHRRVSILSDIMRMISVRHFEVVTVVEKPHGIGQHDTKEDHRQYENNAFRSI